MVRESSVGTACTDTGLLPDCKDKQSTGIYDTQPHSRRQLARLVSKQGARTAMLTAALLLYFCPLSCMGSPGAGIAPCLMYLQHLTC